MTYQNQLLAICSELQLLVQQFGQAKYSCSDVSSLTTTFKSYKTAMLQGMLNAFAPGSAAAAMLELTTDGRFLLIDPTDQSGHAVFPDLSLELDAEGLPQRPKEFGGVAPYCCWAVSTSSLPGFGIILDLQKANELIYHEQAPQIEHKMIGQFKEKELVSNMYKPPDGIEKPWEKSMICCAVFSTAEASQRPQGPRKFKLLGSLDIVHNDAYPFDIEEGIWLTICAQSFARLYELFKNEYPRLSLANCPASAPEDIRIAYIEALDCYRSNAHNAFAAMARRVLELICMNLGATLTPETKLRKAVESLKNQQKLDIKCATQCNHLIDLGKLHHSNWLKYKQLDQADAKVGLEKLDWLLWQLYGDGPADPGWAKITTT